MHKILYQRYMIILYYVVPWVQFQRLWKTKMCRTGLLFCFGGAVYSVNISKGLESARELEICVLRNKNVSLSRHPVLNGVSLRWHVWREQLALSVLIAPVVQDTTDPLPPFFCRLKTVIWYKHSILSQGVGTACYNNMDMLQSRIVPALECSLSLSQQALQRKHACRSRQLRFLQVWDPTSTPV